MIPVIVWGGTQTGANYFKEHLRKFSGETKHHRDRVAKEIIPLLTKEISNDGKPIADRLKNDQWPMKYIFKYLPLDSYNTFMKNQLITRIHHGDFLNRTELLNIALKANKYNYNHVFLYRESLFDQALGWFYEDCGDTYEKNLPDASTFSKKIFGFRIDLNYTYEFLKTKVNLIPLSYESLYLRREKDKVKDILNSMGFKLSVDNIDTFIYNRYKHIKQGNKFKLDETTGPVSESEKYKHLGNFNMLQDYFGNERIEL